MAPADIQVYAVTYPTGKVVWYVHADGRVFDVYPNRQKMLKLWAQRESNPPKDIKPVKLSLADYRRIPVRESTSSLFQAANLALTELRALLEESQTVRMSVYDCDDTLISSESSVVVHKGDERIEMDSATFAHFKPSEGDSIDFSDFNHINHPRIIKRNFEYLRRDADNPEVEVVVLTARPLGSESSISKFLEAQGVRRVQVVALQSSDPEDKGRWVAKQARTKGYSDIKFVDDSRPNVNSVVDYVRRELRLDVKGINVPHPGEDDYEGPPIQKQFHSTRPTTARVQFSRPADHRPSEWWKAQSDEFKKNYCRMHPHSGYCRQGVPR